ncbi:MAG: GNAT family N-acetyltransferase [Gammaproteobacteria bacterium]|nr:GNAT family N-acetyltransferase [Gammaproteobacteria bacterium]MBU0786860.1 GNAT family N-acetyltransferase [Gammaproteobacteria bacterium]MBU0813934.1 GNAT family N-acetyltransferase [Gammaproteobacteria bacterium]MBU1788593.1 GNAT family N-acetyltransferase [Gammaproteobacteria bacterium]
MPKQLTLLLDTNVLIPLQDSYAVLGDNLANFHRLALVGGHKLVYHPASIEDFERDTDLDRRARNLEHVRRYPALERPAKCPWNTPATCPNDACDNEILYALECDAAHALVTEDKGLLTKARARGLGDRTYNIQTAEDWLRRLQQPFDVSLPNIDDVPLHSLTPELLGAFFDSLRDGYDGFDDWFRRKARESRKAWVYRDETGVLGAICVYDVQTDEVVTDEGKRLDGKALKLCTFKVGQRVRGRKVGELFLKAAFRYATENACEHIFIHADVDKHAYLVNLLVDFGFEDVGPYGTDRVFVKRHPVNDPDTEGLSALEYVRRFYPHYQAGPQIQKFLVPIQQEFHRILFPDYQALQSQLFAPEGSVGNAIKLAYLCHAASKQIRPGDVLLFYRSEDEQAVTSLGVVDQFAVLSDAASIAAMVSRRTVYSINEIENMANRPTKVILFRLVKHFPEPASLKRLLKEGVVAGNIQSITKISDEAFSRVLASAGA